MKLVDILARQLREWPVGVSSLSQLQHNGAIINGKGYDGREWDRLRIASDTPPAGVIVTKAQWQAAVDALKADECEHSHGNAEGCPECREEFAPEKGKVTREFPEGTQFIEAGCGEKGFRKFEKGCWWFFEGFWRRVDWKMGALTLVTEHPNYVAPVKAWNGEGLLPPVGTRCEFCRFPEKCGAQWSEVVIVAHWQEGLGTPVAIFMSTGYSPQADQAIADRFRPIRTPEQIAAEKEISDMIDDAMDGHMCLTEAEAEIVCAQLHKAGYRKQESEK